MMKFNLVDLSTHYFYFILNRLKTKLFQVLNTSHVFRQPPGATGQTEAEPPEVFQSTGEGGLYRASLRGCVLPYGPGQFLPH